MFFKAHIKKGSNIDKLWKGQHRTGGSIYGTFFKLKGNLQGGFYQADDVPDPTDLIDHNDLVVEMFSTKPHSSDDEFTLPTTNEIAVHDDAVVDPVATVGKDRSAAARISGVEADDYAAITKHLPAASVKEPTNDGDDIVNKPQRGRPAKKPVEETNTTTDEEKEVK